MTEFELHFGHLEDVDVKTDRKTFKIPCFVTDFSSPEFELLSPDAEADFNDALLKLNSRIRDTGYQVVLHNITEAMGDEEDDEGHMPGSHGAKDGVQHQADAAEDMNT